MGERPKKMPLWAQKASDGDTDIVKPPVRLHALSQVIHAMSDEGSAPGGRKFHSAAKLGRMLSRMSVERAKAGGMRQSLMDPIPSPMADASGTPMSPVTRASGASSPPLQTGAGGGDVASAAVLKDKLSDLDSLLESGVMSHDEHKVARQAAIVAFATTPKFEREM